MGIFSRVRDIISSNISAMLDKAEDPEKLIKLMIREMEDTLVEIKASCAGAMATKKKIGRDLEQARSLAKEWADRAQLAVDKGREDLAREALLEKRRHTERSEALENEQTQCDALVEQYQADIMQLEDKLAMAREKQRILIQRHIHAERKKRAQTEIRRADMSNALAKFETFEQRIDRMEAEADLVNHGRKPTLDEEFGRLRGDEELEKELEELKSASKGSAKKES
ncbi:MAG: phage shock protein PspA [Candidatus Hydrogenedentes bacterium]|nr:phage shock protein PspA [Candidatus Hydrogenedentota bacterium]